MSTQGVTTIAKNTPSAPSTPLPSTALVSHSGRAQPIYKSNIPVPAPQQILEEDDYTEALSKIIERDFFPDIAKLKRQHEYLDAIAMNDTQRIQAAARDLAGNDTPLTQRRLRTPAQTPRIGRTGLPNEAWTPARVDIGNATPTWKDDDPERPISLSEDTPMLDTPTGKTLKKMRKSATETPEESTIDTSLSLDQFQARYTSEDNASFNEILEKMNRRKKEKYSWMYDQEKKSMRLIEQSNNPEMKLLRQSGEDSDLLQRSDDTSTLDKATMQVALTDNRAGTIPTWGYRAKNALMYFPEGLGTNLLDEISRGSPKEIVHNNTNFPDRDLLVVNESAASKIDPAPYLRGEVSDTPKVNGYGFVSSTPTPSMSQMENDPEMMTWGTIEDEPLLISSGISSTGPSPFKLPPTPRRELIAQKLSEKASKSFRDSSSLRAKVFSSPTTSALAKYHNAMGGDTPTPRFSAYPYATGSPTPYRKTPGSTSKSERMASPSPRARAAMLSPAAQSLLNRAKGNRSRDADHQLRSSYGSSGRAGSSRGSVAPSPLTSRPK
ncbi:DiGeorge syndrome critical region protein 14 [Podila horticola]|nr:DiGeorge syndrome critical region protein 14 [Podila horticola]